jgi:hypothetical protein
MNFMKPKKDEIDEISISPDKKFKSDNLYESELKQLESDSNNLLNSIGGFGMSMHRDLAQLKELLTKNIHDRVKSRRHIREGNGRRLLASERFNHGLIENQLLNLKQDLNLGAKDTARRIYRVKREHPYYEPHENEFKTLVEKLKKKATQYELDFVGREDKRQADHNMYMQIWADIQDEFRKFEGKHQMDIDSFISEDAAKKAPTLAKKIPKELKEGDSVPSPFSNNYDIARSTKHDSNTKSLLDGYFKVIQKFLEDAIYTKNLDVKLMEEFYEFEKSFHNMDDSFENIWDILTQIFNGIEYTTVECFSDNPNELQRRLCRNTWGWFEREFRGELQLDEIIAQFTKDPYADYEITEELITAVIDRLLYYMKDYNYEVDDSKLELEDEKLPIYALIYFCLRAGKRKEALKIASKSTLHDAKLIYNILKETTHEDSISELPQNEKLYNTALTALSSINRLYESTAEDPAPKKDIFKEAIFILLTKHTSHTHPLLNANLSDYLWFNLARCSFTDESNSPIVTLKSLQSSILTHGSSYFNEDGSTPLNFYKVLIFTGLYEEAIEYLDKIDINRVENTHVAISLNEIGILSQNTFWKVLKSFIEFVGKDYFEHSLIYATLMDSKYLIPTISDLFIRHNSFAILLETSPQTNLNLLSKSNLPFSMFVNKQTLSKVIHQVCKKVALSTPDPHIRILLYNKIGDDRKVVDLVVLKQGLEITNKKPSLYSTSKSYYTEEAIMSKENLSVQNMALEYKNIVDKIRK